MSLSEQDREAVMRQIVHGAGCKRARGYADRCYCADDLLSAVEQIVARHVAAALDEAVREVDLHLGSRRALLSPDFTDGLISAARIVRSRKP